MGFKTRVVTESITEATCDLCKGTVQPDAAMVGRLEVKAFGARGRASSIQVAFHRDCLGKLTATAAKARTTASTARKAPRSATVAKAARPSKASANARRKRAK